MGVINSPKGKTLSVQKAIAAPGRNYNRSCRADIATHPEVIPLRFHLGSVPNAFASPTFLRAQPVPTTSSRVTRLPTRFAAAHMAEITILAWSWARALRIQDPTISYFLHVAPCRKPYISILIVLLLAVKSSAPETWADDAQTRRVACQYSQQGDAGVSRTVWVSTPATGLPNGALAVVWSTAKRGGSLKPDYLPDQHATRHGFHARVPISLGD